MPMSAAPIYLARSRQLQSTETTHRDRSTRAARESSPLHAGVSYTTKPAGSPSQNNTFSPYLFQVASLVGYEDFSMSYRELACRWTGRHLLLPDAPTNVVLNTLDGAQLFVHWIVKEVRVRIDRSAQSQMT